MDRYHYCGERCYQESLDAIPAGAPVESQLAMAGGKPVPRMFLEEGGKWPALESDYPLACDQCEEWIAVSLTPAGLDATREVYGTADPEVREAMERAYPFLSPD